MKKEFWYFSVFIAFISFISIIGLFLHPGQPTTFDARAHITSIAQFSVALSQGNFPVVWLGNVANYGTPGGLYVQQLSNYTGGLINILLHNPYASYVVVLFISIFLSGILFYKFLRLYISPLSSLLGVVLLTFAPFRIIDIYVRGDLPEIFSDIFLPLILLCLYYFVTKKNIQAYFGLILAVAGLVLSHPMAFVIYSFLFVPYFFFLLFEKFHTVRLMLSKEGVIYILYFFLAVVIGMGMASYYLLPLFIEQKYLLYVKLPTHFDKNQILGWANFFSPFWYRNTSQFIKVGLLEMGGVILFLLHELYKLKKRKFSFGLGEFVFSISVLYIFFLTKFSYWIYEHTVLAQVQYGWRMLAGFIFLPPMLYALLIDKLHKKWIILAFVVFVFLVRIPQLYGKNFVSHTNSYYEFTDMNVYAPYMNTLWIQKPEDYPIKSTKVDILEHGNGRILSSNIQNAKRTYIIDAKERLHMIDYTFYFPGWSVYIDNQPTTIEFQNYLYKGVITYYVPAGKHVVTVVLKDTLVRKLGKAISVVFILLFLLLILLRKKLFLTKDKRGKGTLLFLGFGR